jgi:hypothetical protein
MVLIKVFDLDWSELVLVVSRIGPPAIHFFISPNKQSVIITGNNVVKGPRLNTSLKSNRPEVLGLFNIKALAKVTELGRSQCSEL